MAKNRSSSELTQTTTSPGREQSATDSLYDTSAVMGRLIAAQGINAEARNFYKFKPLLESQFGSAGGQASFDLPSETAAFLTSGTREAKITLGDREYAGVPYQPRVGARDLPKTLTIGRSSYEIQLRDTAKEWRKTGKGEKATHQVWLGLFGDFYIVHPGRLEDALYAVRGVCASKGVQAHFANRAYAATHINSRSTDLIANIAPLLDVARAPYGRLQDGTFDHPWYTPGQRASYVRFDFGPWEFASDLGSKMDVFTVRKQILDYNEEDLTAVAQRMFVSPQLTANQGTPVALQLSFRNLRKEIIKKETRSAGLSNVRGIAGFPSNVQWADFNLDLPDYVYYTFFGDQLHYVGDVFMGKKAPIGIFGRQEVGEDAVKAVTIVELANTQKQHVFNVGFLFFDRIPVDNDFTSIVCKDEKAERSWDQAKGAFVHYVNLGVLPLTELPQQILSRRFFPP